jgi:5-methylcytosine-specific restriction protein A
MRKEFSAKVKAEAFRRAAGRCESCTSFLVVGKFAYDHDNPDGLTGEPTLANCRVLCNACHGRKTKLDVRNIAKAKRRERNAAGIKKPRRITRWRRFDGSIVEASRERS